MGICLKLMEFLEKVTFSMMILVIASELVGAFFLQEITLCAKSCVERKHMVPTS